MNTTIIENIFSNREIAIGVWVVLFLFWMLSKSKLRLSFKDVLKSFADRKILILFTLLLIYILLSLCILSAFELWDLSQVKNTIIWLVFVAFVSFLNINTICNDSNFFRNSITKHLKIIVVIEFIISFYTFNLITELIIVPISTILSMVIVFSEQKEEYKSVHSLLSKLFNVTGLLLIMYCMYMLIINLEKFATNQTLIDFSTPILLSILFLPFLYMLYKYMLYERILCMVNIYTDCNKIRVYAKTKALIHFKFDIDKIRRWLEFSCQDEFKNKTTINNSLINFSKNKLNV